MPKRQLPRLRSNAWFWHLFVLVLSIAVLSTSTTIALEYQKDQRNRDAHERFATCGPVVCGSGSRDCSPAILLATP